MSYLVKSSEWRLRAKARSLHRCRNVVPRDPIHNDWYTYKTAWYTWCHWV